MYPIKQWIHYHFKSSTFNTCPHQPLQTMKECCWTLYLLKAVGPWYSTKSNSDTYPGPPPLEKQSERRPRSRHCTGYNWTFASDNSYNLVWNSNGHSCVCVYILTDVGWSLCVRWWVAKEGILSSASLTSAGVS